MASYLDETGLGTLISLIKKWTLDEIASSGGGGGSSYVLPVATSSTLGGIKTGYSANGKNYPVALDDDGKAYVNVPWTDPESPAEPYELPAASSNTRGGVRVGDNLSVTDTDKLGLSAEFLERISNIEGSIGEPYELPAASSSTRGGIRVGDNLEVTDTDKLGLSAEFLERISNIEGSIGEPYELPAATSSTLGGVKVGAGLSIEEDGTLSAPSLDMQPIDNEYIDGLFATLQEAAGS